ncbi:hypothetical protein EE612_002887 [Oryza sativa]|nr:hypothetical protein EE612_002887 [Oryza sativa]
MASIAMAASLRTFLRPHRCRLLLRQSRSLSASAAPAGAAAASTVIRRSVVEVLRERGLVEATTSESLGSASASP